jgi:hypothetical protein
MIVALRLFFSVVLLSMLVVTSWAGSQVALWNIPLEIGAHPWFIATLADAYWGFFVFYVWLCHKEPAWLARALWLLALTALGNIAVAAYGLAVTLRLPRDARPTDILLRRRPVSPLLPASLILALGLVSALAALG